MHSIIKQIFNFYIQKKVFYFDFSLDTFCNVALPSPVFLSFTGLPGLPPPPKFGINGPPVNTLGSSSSSLKLSSVIVVPGLLEGLSIGMREIKSSLLPRSPFVLSLTLSEGRVGLGGNFGLLLTPGRKSPKPTVDVDSDESNLEGVTVGRTRSGRELVGRMPVKESYADYTEFNSTGT